MRWFFLGLVQRLDFRQTARELAELGRVNGPRFLAAAIAWELVEDVVLPAIAVELGAAWLAPVFLAVHFEPIVYPALLLAFAGWDRLRRRGP